MKIPKNLKVNIHLFILLAPLVLLLTLGGCKKTDDDVISSGSDSTATGSNSSSTVSIDSTNSQGTIEGNTGRAEDSEDLIANSTFGTTVSINFGSTVTITNPLSATEVSVTESGGDVVINSTVAGVDYVLSGTTTSGSVKIYSEKKFKLTLNGVNITNNDGPAINIQSGKRVFVVLNSGTTNSLTDASSYATSTEDQKGTFFSEGQLIFSGSGALNVVGKYKHAIVSDDYIRVISGTINVTGAVGDGFHTNDAFIVDGGIISVKATDDGIQCEEGYIVINDGVLTVDAVDKGITASWDTDTTIDPYITINGGTISVKSSQNEGIESKSTLTINNGNITIVTYDDAINAGKAIYINGGTTYAYASNNDGIDSNGTITITGGRTISVGAGSPEEGFDCDSNTFKITGGTIVGIGGATSSPTASVSTQASAILGGTSANQIIHIESSAGKEVLTFLVPRTFATLLFTTPKLKTSDTYTVYLGGSVENGTTANGLYLTGTYTKGTKSSTFTASTMVTKAGGSIGPGGGGGR